MIIIHPALYIAQSAAQLVGERLWVSGYSNFNNALLNIIYYQI